MAKNGFFCFMLGAAAATAGLYLVKKTGGLEINIQVNSASQQEPAPDAEVELTSAGDEASAEELCCDEAEGTEADT